MKSNIIPAIRLTLVCLVFFCGVYTLIVWAIAQAAPNNGKGAIVVENNKTYHINVAQSFTEDRYFWSRPSAVDYDAAGSGGSNYGPTNPDHLKEVRERIDQFLERNPTVKKSEIPADLVTASGSGLDPHISIQAARVQAKRIAKARNLTDEAVTTLIEKCTEKPLFGLFGTERINVLKINIALDSMG